MDQANERELTATLEHPAQGKVWRESPLAKAGGGALAVAVIVSLLLYPPWGRHSMVILAAAIAFALTLYWQRRIGPHWLKYLAWDILAMLGAWSLGVGLKAVGQLRAGTFGEVVIDALPWQVPVGLTVVMCLVVYLAWRSDQTSEPSAPDNSSRRRATYNQQRQRVGTQYNADGDIHNPTTLAQGDAQATGPGSVAIAGHAPGAIVATGAHATIITGTVIQRAAEKPTINPLHQLPEPPHDFTGRQEELDNLRQQVGSTGASISGLRGMGGIGKTALSLVLAKELSSAYPDAQLFLEIGKRVKAYLATLRRLV